MGLRKGLLNSYGRAILWLLMEFNILLIYN